MSDYLCKDCPENNNGWCKKRKTNGLKKITECDFRDGKVVGFIKDLKSNVETNIYNDIHKNSGKYKQFGKREMFYHIQQQMLAIDKDVPEEEKFKLLKQTMVSLEKVLQIEEKIHGVALEYELDEDILNTSKKVSQYWLNTVGEYKEKGDR